MILTRCTSIHFQNIIGNIGFVFVFTTSVTINLPKRPTAIKRDESYVKTNLKLFVIRLILTILFVSVKQHFCHEIVAFI